jgi:hypothetical protein
MIKLSKIFLTLIMMLNQQLPTIVKYQAGRKLGRPSTCTVTREQVLIARKEGLTWVQVGEQLGISTTKACDLGRAA